MDVSDFETFEALKPSGLPSPEKIRAAVKKVGENVEALIAAPIVRAFCRTCDFSPAAPLGCVLRHEDLRPPNRRTSPWKDEAEGGDHQSL